MSLPRRLSAAALFILTAVSARAAGASSVQVVSEDDRGVTLRVDLPAFESSGIAPDARIDLRVPGFERTATPGRPRLPYAHALVAVPQGARVTGAMVASDGDQVVDGIDVTLGADPVTSVDPATGDLQPGFEPARAIQDGVWPSSPVVVGEPFTVRRQRLVAVEIYPYRYDAATRRLWTRRSITVRVSFSGGTTTGLSAQALPQEDRHWDPVFQDAVVNFNRGRRWRASPAPPAGGRRLSGRSARTGALAAESFDEDEPEVRVQIDSTGAWGLDFDELVAKGYPAGVPIAEVSVHRHEYVEDATPPYETIELPCEVIDANSNGTFDSGDRILVWVQNWAERSQASVPQRYWGDAEVIYVTRVRLPRGGARMATRSGWRNSISPLALTSFPWTKHFEGNYDYANSGSALSDTTRDPFHWTNFIAYYARPDTIQFETNDLDTSRSALVNVRWQGRANESHFVWGVVKNATNKVTTCVDSAFFFGRTTLTSGTPMFGSALSEGPRNYFRTWAKTFNSPPDPTTNARALVGLDWFEVTYWRRYRALIDQLDCNSGAGDGEVELLAHDFSDSTLLRAWDVSDSTAPVRLTGVHFEPNAGRVDLRMQDSVASADPHRYVIFDQPKIPPSAMYTRVTRVGLSQNVAGDYLLVVPEAFLPAVAPLVQLRQAEGLAVVLAPLEAVFDEFNGGRHSAHAIKRFVRYGFQHWSTQFLMLVGDGTEDPKKVNPGSGDDWVPIMRIMGPVLATTTSGSFFEGVPSDPWYGWCLECADPQLAPRLPDVFVGRLPVNSLASAQAVITKLVKYEQPQADENWKKGMVLMSDDAYSGESTFGNGSTSNSYCYHSYEEIFHQINENIGGLIVNEAGLTQCRPDTFNVSYYLPTLPADTLCAQPPAPEDTCRCDRTTFQQRAYAIFTPQLMNRLNAGTLWWNYQGHANEYVMAHEAIYVNNPARDDKDLLRNDDHLFLFSAFSCHPNAFAHLGENSRDRGTPSFGEDLVTLPARGAVASWASSGYELLPTDDTDHLNVHFARALFGNSPRDPYIVTKGARAVLGEVIAKALLNLYPAPSPNERDVGITYTLLGDPATTISIGEPQAMVTANTQPVASGQRVALRTGRDTLDVEADLVSNTRIDSVSVTRTEPNGAVTPIPPLAYLLTPALGDTGAASNRGRHYHLSYFDTLLADSYHYTLRTVDRDKRANPFDVVFTFETVAFANGAPLNDLDVIPPNAALSLRVLSPRPLVPQRDLELRINGDVQAFTADSASGDHTGREWTLAWTHGSYPFGQTVVQLKAANGATRIHRVQVTVTGAELRLQNPLAFPNPFEDDLGTYFSFTLESATAADVRIRVYSMAGRLLYERRELGMLPGYHQLAWDGRDAEGDKLANGVYFYRIAASNGSSSTRYEGRLVKLRKPHHVDETTP